MRALWLSVLGFALVGCSRADPQHCFNNPVGEVCTDPAFPHCSSCVAANDGCVARLPDDPACRDDRMTAADSDDGQGSVDGSSATTQSGGGGSSTTWMTTSTSEAGETTDSTSSGSTSLDSGTSGDTGPTPPTCGDGLAEGDEQCDGDDLRGADCMSFGLDQGTLGCGTECRYDLSNCPGFDSCGNGTIDDWEECEEGDLGGTTCRDLADFSGGTLACDDCRFNTTDCDPCKQGGSCSEDGECCSQNCTALNLCL